MIDNSKLKNIKNNLYSWGRKGFEDKFYKFKNKKHGKQTKEWKELNKHEVDLSDQSLYRYQTNKISIFNLIFLFSAGIFIISIILFSFFFFFSEKKANIVEPTFNIISKNVVKAGEVFPLNIQIENNTKKTFKNVRLSIQFPETAINTVTNQPLQDKVIEYKKLLPGEFKRESVDVTLFGSINSQHKFIMKLLYNLDNSSAVIVRQKEYKVLIEDSPIFVEVEAPKEIFSDKEFTLKAKISSNIHQDLNNLIIVARYPSSFKLKESTPVSVFSDATHNVFRIDSLKSGESQEISITGKLFGLNKDIKFFFFEAGLSSNYNNEIGEVFVKAEKQIVIRKPDIDFRFFVKNTTNKYSTDDIIALPGEKILFLYELENNLDNILSDIRVDGKLLGEFFDKRLVYTQSGYFNSTDGTMLWDKSLDDDFAALSGGQKIKREFGINILPFKEIAGYVKDPKIILNMSVGANSFDENSVVVSNEIIQKQQRIIKIPTTVNLYSDTLYYDGPFSNAGSIKPIVGEPTTYTIRWQIYNSNSDIENVKVRAKLPPYVKWLGEVSPKGAYLKYNPKNREITWMFKKIHAFIGYRTEPKTVYFKISFTPSATQIGTTPLIVGRQTLLADDKFVDRVIEVNSGFNTTDIKNDSKRELGDGIVKDTNSTVNENNNSQEEKTEHGKTISYNEE